MSTNSTQVHSEYERELLSKGYKQTNEEKNVPYNGRLVDKLTYEKNNIEGNKAARVGHAALTVAGTIGSLGYLPIKDKDFQDEIAIPAIKGKTEKPVYLERDKPEDIRGLTYTAKKISKKTGTNKVYRYNPKDRASIAKYIRALIRDGSPAIHRLDNGALVVLEKRRKGISSYLYVPPGENLDKATFDPKKSKVTSIKMWDVKTGGPIDNEGDAWKAINSFNVSDAEINKALDKVAEKLAKQKLKEEGKLKDDPSLPFLKKKIRRRLAAEPVKLNVQDGLWKLGSNDLNKPNKNQHISGSLEDGTKKKIGTYYNDKLMEHKGQLSGEQPYKDRPTLPPLGSGSYSDNDDDAGFDSDSGDRV